MRSKREIKDRLRQASFRYLKTILDKRLKVVPANCGHNEWADIAPGIVLGMCTIFDETGVRVCDSRVPGCREAASSCEWFVHQQSKEGIKEEWEALLLSAQAGGRAELVRQGYGDLASLLWALDDEAEGAVVGAEPVSGPEGDPSQHEPKISAGDVQEVALNYLVEQRAEDESEGGEKPGFWNRLFGG